MNEYEVPCFECANQLRVYGNDNIICGICGKEYLVKENTRYGIGGSPSFQSLSCNENSVVINYLENIPLNLLEKAFEQHVTLSNSESKPTRLFEPVKDYYDSIFKRIQDVLGSNRSNLSSEEIERINSNPRSNGYNLHKIMMRIPDAFPNYNEKSLVFVKGHEQIAKELTWLRHKIEHIAIRQWPTPAYVNSEYGLSPSDKSEINFNAEFLNQVNFFVVGLYSMIIEIDDRNTQDFEFENIEQYRLPK